MTVTNMVEDTTHSKIIKTERTHGIIIIIDNNLIVNTTKDTVRAATTVVIRIEIVIGGIKCL